MTSQFKSIIEKIKTDKNVQVAVASIAAATVLVIGGTMYYVSHTHHQTGEQTYKKAASIGSEKYEKVRKDEESDTKIDDKLVESISSTTSSSSSNSSNSNNSTNSSSSSSGTSSSSNSQSVTQTNQSSQSSQSSQSTQSNDSSSAAETTSANTEDNRKEDSSRKTESKSKSKSKSESVKKSSSGKSSRSKRSADQSDWDENQSETRKSEEVSGDNWNDEDSVEELNLQR